MNWKRNLSRPVDMRSIKLPKKGAQMEEKVPETIEEVQKEYNHLCANIGHNEYIRRIQESHLEQMYVRAQKLSQKASELRANKEQEAPLEASPMVETQDPQIPEEMIQ